MASFDAVEMAEVAQKLLTEFGSKVTLRTFNPPTANESQPWRPDEGSPAFVESEVTAVFLPMGGGKPPSRYADGTESQVGDLKVYVGVEATPELQSMIVRGDDSKWIVKHVETLNPNGIAIVHKLWVTR